MPTISGNVGGTAGSGAVVTCRSKNGAVSMIGAADSSGNFSFAGLPDNTVYDLSAYLNGFTIRKIDCVRISGGNDVSAVNFRIDALNGNNSSLG